MTNARPDSPMPYVIVAVTPRLQRRLGASSAAGALALMCDLVEEGFRIDGLSDDKDKTIRVDEVFVAADDDRRHLRQ